MPVDSADAPLSVQVATAALTGTPVQLPMAMLLSRNVTVPPGVPAPGAVADKVTVNVTELPNADGETLVASAPALLALFTLCVRAALVLLARKLVSPS